MWLLICNRIVENIVMVMSCCMLIIVCYNLKLYSSSTLEPNKEWSRSVLLHSGTKQKIEPLRSTIPNTERNGSAPGIGMEWLYSNTLLNQTHSNFLLGLTEVLVAIFFLLGTEVWEHESLLRANQTEFSTSLVLWAYGLVWM